MTHPILDTIVPALPSWNRYKNLFRKKKVFSILRELQYEIIAQVPLKGKVLDLGGGNKADYRNILQCEAYESVNIDPKIEPTWLSKAEESFPCPQNHYDTVISFNTIEHIFEAQEVLEDMFKALKPGGTLICTTPFLYPIHGHPDDFFRPTGSWWRSSLLKTGFKDVQIQPLLWGPFSTAIVCSGLPGPFKKIRTHFALILDIIYVRLRFAHSQEYFSGQIGENIQNYVLGFLVRARK